MNSVKGFLLSAVAVIALSALALAGCDDNKHKPRYHGDNYGYRGDDGGGYYRDNCYYENGRRYEYDRDHNRYYYHDRKDNKDYYHYPNRGDDHRNPPPRQQKPPQPPPPQSSPPPRDDRGHDSKPNHHDRDDD